MKIFKLGLKNHILQGDVSVPEAYQNRIDKTLELLKRGIDRNDGLKLADVFYPKKPIKPGGPYRVEYDVDLPQKNYIFSVYEDTEKLPALDFEGFKSTESLRFSIHAVTKEQRHIVRLYPHVLWWSVDSQAKAFRVYIPKDGTGIGDMEGAYYEEFDLLSYNADEAREILSYEIFSRILLEFKSWVRWLFSKNLHLFKYEIIKKDDREIDPNVITEKQKSIANKYLEVLSDPKRIKWKASRNSHKLESFYTLKISNEEFYKAGFAKLTPRVVKWGSGKFARWEGVLDVYSLSTFNSTTDSFGGRVVTIYLSKVGGSFVFDKSSALNYYVEGKAGYHQVKKALVQALRDLLQNFPSMVRFGII